MAIRVMQTSQPLQDPAVLALRNRLRSGELVSGGGQLDVPAIVRKIILDVQARGDAAVLDATRTLHYPAARLGDLRVRPDEIAAAQRDCFVPSGLREPPHGADGDFLKLIRRAADNIRQYQESILVKAPPPLRRGGRELAVRYTPMDRVAVYVPGGKALYPSTVLMTVIPAQVAGVKEIAMVTVPQKDGRADPQCLALAGELGVSEVYAAAGVAALAALAIGTPMFPAVQKIVGPGSAFIAEAKRQLFGRVGIDSIAGPSEVLIIADKTARADFIAADMLAQAEHDPGSAILITDSAELARNVAEELDRQVAQLERAEAARAGLEAYSAIIVVGSIASACELANEFATEHLEIMTADDAAALSEIRNAGAIFVGPHSPVPVGDYYAGPSHVLPTGGTAKFSGPLSCNDFLKASSVVKYDAASLSADADDIAGFAAREGLTAHAKAVRIRSRKGP